jgi:hypothetical protein
MILALLLLAANIKAPSNFQAAPSQTSVALSWSFNGNGTGFQIDRQQSGSFERVAALPISARFYTDQNLTPGTQYSYRIRTYKNNQFSQYVYLTVTTDSVPAPMPCPGALVISGEYLLVINAQVVNGLSLVQAAIDGIPYAAPFLPVPLQPFGQSWEVTPTVTGNFIAVIPTTTLLNGCHAIGAFATDTTSVTGSAQAISIEVRN